MFWHSAFSMIYTVDNTAKTNFFTPSPGRGGVMGRLPMPRHLHTPRFGLRPRGLGPCGPWGSCRLVCAHMTAPGPCTTRPRALVRALGPRSKRRSFLYRTLTSPDGRETRRRLSSMLWKINACPTTYYMISATPGGYAAAWPTMGDFYFARLDPNGNLLTLGEIKKPGHSSMRSGVIALGCCRR